MTAWLIVRAVRRWWYLAVAGLLATCGAVYLATQAEGVYHQQVYVIFLAPSAPNRVNTYQFVPDSLIATAGLVNRQVNDGGSGPAAVSAKVTIVDLGIREGSLVRMPNAGGQWIYSYDRPVLDVQASGEDPQQVRATLAAVVERIRTTLHDGERALGVSPDNMIDTTLSPPSPPVLKAQGSRSRAGAAVLVLGLGLTLSVVVWIDQWLVRRMVRRPQRFLSSVAPAN